MKLIEVYQIIQTQMESIFRTNDIAIVLGVSNPYGYKLLRQLSDAGFLFHLRRDVWGIKERVDPLMLPDYLTAPMPSYVSLQSALYYHGMIEQISSVIYVISQARTRRYHTAMGVYSIHHIKPELFQGFDSVGEREIKIATKEKALFDFFYLKAAKNQLFYKLPELEIPKGFEWSQLKSYADLVENKSRKAMIFASLEQYNN